MKYLITLLSVIFLGGSLYMLDGLIKQISILAIGSGLVFILFNIKSKFLINSTHFVVYYLFVICCIISGLVNSDIKLLLSTIMLIVIYISLILIFPSLAKDRSPKLVYRAILISQGPIIIISLIFSDLNTDRFQGIFNNSNSFGSVAVTMFTVFFAVLINYVHDYVFNVGHQEKLNFLKYILLCVFFFYLVLISSSRTSAIAAGGLVLISSSLVLIKVFFRKRIILLWIKRLLNISLLVILVILVFVFPLYEVFSETVLKKFDTKLQAGDVLDKRGFIWMITLKEASLFGHGSNYFDEKFNMGAHNTYISLLGQFGWVALIFFILFLLMSLKDGIQFALSWGGGTYRFVPLSLLITFILLSFGEGMMLKVSMLGAFACSGYLSISKYISRNFGTMSLDKKMQRVSLKKGADFKILG